jgi:hypothetical protein
MRLVFSNTTINDYTRRNGAISLVLLQCLEKIKPDPVNTSQS